MSVAVRVARRFIARTTSRLEFLADEQKAAIGSLANLSRYRVSLGKARDVLQPVVGCLKSRPLVKLYVSLTTAVDALPDLGREVEGILMDLHDVNRALVLEAQRHAELARADEDHELDTKDVRLPTAAVRALQSRIKQYHDVVEKTFDQSFSLDDIGTAGSADLKAYERLIEKLPAWEELNVADIELDGLDDAVVSHATDLAYG